MWISSELRLFSAMADNTNNARAVTPDNNLTPGAVIAPDVAPRTDIDNRSNRSTSEKHPHGVQRAAHNPPEYSSDNDKNEKAGIIRSDGEVDSESQQVHDASAAPPSKWAKLGPVYRYRRPLTHFFIFGLFTGWWIASLVLHRNDKNWVIPFLLWLAIMLRLVFYYFPSRYVSQALRWVWDRTAVPVVQAIPPRFRSLAGGVGALAAVLVGTFASEEYEESTHEARAISLFGLIVMLFAFWGTSKHRSRVNWQTVIVGMLAQYIIGLFVLRTQVGLDIFSWIATHAALFLSFAKDGVAFLTSPDTANTPMFFWGVIPAIIFFISVVQVLYYIGFLQWFVRKAATFVFWLLGVSGAEAVVAAATPFIGQGESAVMVRPFVPHMTKAELHQVMTCGFATISGSVLAGYISLGLPASVLVSSCIMSIPASLAFSKLRYPETEETLTAGRVVIPEDDDDKAENALHAFAKGALLGLRIAGSIITSILCILAVVGLINGLLTWWGRYLNINDPTLTLQTIFGYIFYPVAFLLGINRGGPIGPDGKEEKGIYLLRVGKLIAEKVITNEYVAFTELARLKEQLLITDRSALIAAYAICGFGNIGSLGIQIGILSQLAPSRGGDIAKLAFSALVTGVFATLSSAAVAGLVITDQVDSITIGAHSGKPRVNMGTISLRDSIRWIPDEASEPTSTIVVTSPQRRFVDLRILRSALPPHGEGANEILPLSSLDWGIAGTSSSTERDDGHGGKISGGRWTHWVDSRTKDAESATDEGDEFEQPGGLTLEKGRMVNPATGLPTDYEEVWRSVKPLPSQPNGRVRCVVLDTKSEDGSVRGRVVRLGQFCQGLLRDGDEIVVERWERLEERGWHSSLRIGDQVLACAEAVAEDGQGNELVEGATTEVAAGFLQYPTTSSATKLRALELRWPSSNRALLARLERDVEILLQRPHPVLLAPQLLHQLGAAVGVPPPHLVIKQRHGPGRAAGRRVEHEERADDGLHEEAVGPRHGGQVHDGKVLGEELEVREHVALAPRRHLPAGAVCRGRFGPARAVDPDALLRVGVLRVSAVLEE
ncbi:Solute carrier family 28 member 3 [Paramyrothecium foliicola]|nr:Solute carrier family 28 member 3 [Paramyrothecium foliicola]